MFRGLPLRASKVALKLRIDRPKAAAPPPLDPTVGATPSTVAPHPPDPLRSLFEQRTSAPLDALPKERPQLDEEQPGKKQPDEQALDEQALDEQTPDRPGLVAAAEPPEPQETPETRPQASEPDRPPQPLSWVALVLTFALGLGLGLLVWVFSTALDEELPSRPELRRLALENRTLQQSLERQRVELEGQLHKAEIEDARLRHEWSAIVEEIAALRDVQDHSTARAQDLSDRLEIFVRRAQSLAQRTDLPEVIRRQATALGEEGDIYRAALSREMQAFAKEKQRFADWIARLDEEAKTRLVRGVAVRIIHDRRRSEDAARVAALLNEAGAEAHLFATDIANPESHKGRIYYHGRSEEAAARQIAHMVEAIESLHVEPIGVTNPFLSLWLVGEPAAPF